MKKEQSAYLLSVKPQVKRLIEILKDEYEYVSVLATDVTGTSYSYGQRMKSINPYRFSERGFVVRAYQSGGYQEYSFNQLENVEALAKKIITALKAQKELLEGLAIEKYETPLIYEEEMAKEFANEEADSINTTSKEEIMEKLKSLSDAGVGYPAVMECQASFTHVVVNKMFISEKKDLIQAFTYSLASYFMLGFKDGKTNANRKSTSGFKGVEALDEIAPEMDECYEELMSLFDATNIAPGEYTIITDPEGAGLIAHEAFGHGLEMDMFVKNRAVAKDHMGEMIASSITNMYDGATEVEDSASYFFDDEGTISSTTQILKDGYLVAGMNDVLSALRLDTKPTGNGRRESFERKAYTRMTNTYFGKGDSTLEGMIASTEYGFLVEGGQSGMEDPKHWGIQCVLSRAKEIKDGKLTGKVFTPVILTGYVPDLLANISMVGKDVVTNGNGMCGKGHKEWVVVSDGGPYIKTKVRLG